MKKPLTDTLIRSIAAPASVRVEISDERCSGLTFRVTANGVRSWSFRFRDPRSNRLTRATLGTYPDLSLAKAREKAIDMRRAVAKGTNPVDEKRREREQAITRTFGALADRYLKEHARRFKKTAEADERALTVHILPKWGARPAEKIKPFSGQEYALSVASGTEAENLLCTVNWILERAGWKRHDPFGGISTETKCGTVGVNMTSGVHVRASLDANLELQQRADVLASGLRAEGIEATTKKTPKIFQFQQS